MVESAGIGREIHVDELICVLRFSMHHHRLPGLDPNAIASLNIRVQFPPANISVSEIRPLKSSAVASLPAPSNLTFLSSQSLLPTKVRSFPLSLSCHVDARLETFLSGHKSQPPFIGSIISPALLAE
jgi:hypothetical protein